MAGGKKGVSILVKLVSTAGTGYFYVKRKNPRNLPNKLQFVKYDPRYKLVNLVQNGVSALCMPVGKDALLVALAAAGLISVTNKVLQLLLRWRRGNPLFVLQPWDDGSCREIADGVEGLIGDTPLVRIRSLSEQTGCEILAKAEMLNIGGSVKDRVALEVVREAMAEGCLKPGGLITEGTAGSTGVSLALVAAGRGCRCRISMPDDAAAEKAQLLCALGADVRRVRPVSITHPEHFVNVARREATAEPGSALFANQFENLANFRAHLRTGREIWRQTRGRLHAFVSGAGTGGTIAGVSCYLKSQDPRIKVMLVDPPGSSLFNKVKRGVLYAREEAEGKRLRNPFDTITEGIGINRITANFSLAKVDDAFKGSDREAVEMAAYLLHNDGLFVGSSTAMNCVGAVKAARALGKGHTIVTVLCDGGQRHLSKFHNPEYLAQHGLVPQHTGRDLSFVE